MLESIGRYIFKERIGAGAQATVWLADDPELDREVAVKVMHQVASEDTRYLDALRAEARLAAGLSHPNITPIHDFLVQDGFACIVMEYFPDSLDRKILTNGAMSQAELIKLSTQICEALAYAHGRGLVHRDIKPHNILLDEDGIPKVTDFGIARATDVSATATAMGTPLYMSPEQCLGDREPNRRSDIYAMGIVMYEMLSGHPPFTGSVPQLYQAHINEPIPDFSTDLNIPTGLSDIIQKCMKKDPEDRYQNATEIASALRSVRLEAGSQPAARAAAPMPQPEPADLPESIPTGRDWRRQGQYTVLGLAGEDDITGPRQHVQSGADEIAIVRKNGEISDVFSETRKPTMSKGALIASIFGFGPKTEIYKATRTRFNLVFWLGDDDTVVTNNKTFSFGLPVLDREGQAIPARINLWIELDESRPENLLLLLRGRNVINRFDVASEIRDDLLGKVVGLELNQHTVNEMRGNEPLLRTIGASIRREISGTLRQFGLQVQDYSINWGLTLEESSEINQQKHELSVNQIRNLNEIERLRRGGASDVPPDRGAVEVILRPSMWARAIAILSFAVAIIFLAINSGKIIDAIGGSEPPPSNALVVPTESVQYETPALPPTVAPILPAPTWTPVPTYTPQPTYTPVPAPSYPVAAPAAPAPAAAPPAPPQAGRDRTIRMAIREVSDQFGDFEVQTYGGSPGELQMGFYDQLLVHDGTDPLSPFAAKSWHLNPSGERLSLEIRKDLKCNTPAVFEGKDFGYITAEDVAWNMDRQNAVVNPSLGPAIGAQLGGTFGPAVVIGEYTVEVPVITKLTWGVPLSEFDINDTTVRLDCKQAYVQMGAEAIKFVPVGSGPWTIGEWRPNNIGEVHAVTDHWIEPPHIGTFAVIQVPDTSSRMALMQTGEADLGEVDYGKLRELESKGLNFIATMSDSDTMTLSAIWPGNLWTDLNAKTEEALEPWLSPVYETDLPHLGCPWGNKCPYNDTDNPDGVSDMEQARLVRWALSMAILRESMLDVLYGNIGTPIYSENMGPKFPGWDPNRTVNQATINGYHEKYSNTMLNGFLGRGTDWVEYDVPAAESGYEWPWEIPTAPREAERLLDLAGYPRGPDGVRFEISLNRYACETGDVCLETADAVAYSWEQVGVKTRLLNEEYGSVVVPRMRDRTQRWPVVKNCSVETANYPLDWPPPPSDSTFSRPGWGCAFESKFLDYMYIAINMEPDKSKREAMHLDMIDYYYYWQFYAGILQPPRGVASNPYTVDSWSSRSSAGGYWGRPQHIIPAK